MGQDPDTPQTIPFKAYIVILLMGIGLFNNTFFGVAPAASAYTIAAALDGNDKRMWIVQAQGIPSIASGPIVSIIADVYGRKATIILLALLAAIASIICMTTNSMDVLLLGQVMNGIAGGISGLLYAIPSEVVPSRYRSIVQGFLSIISGGGAYAALLGMGAATSADTVNGWRWVWRTQLVCNGVLILGFAIFYNPPPRTKSDLTFWGRVKTLDWIGYFLLTSGLIPILMGFAWAADANYGWSDLHAYACVVAGTISFVLCLLYEWKGTSTGFLHHALFQNRNFPLLMFTMAVEGHMFYAVNNMYSGEVYGLWFTDVSAMKQSAALLPFFASVMVVTPLVAFYSTKFKQLKWPVVFGILAFLVATIGWATCTADSWIRALVFSGVAGLGFASILMLLVTLVQLSTPPLYIGVASALAISARTLGGTVGYGVSTVIYNNLYDSRMATKIAAAVAPLGFDMSNVGSLIGGILSHNTAAVPGLTPDILAAANAANREASEYAYARIWWATIPAVILALFGMTFIRDPSDRMDWVVDAPLEKIKHQVEAGKVAEDGGAKVVDVDEEK
ncbi:hypothetical protein A1Q2_00699 [Trichosporon asahii var. asahii CBS 8904]|uniref:Major facilitator superfamily (MFS) profile domain-containing protein n=1 Tax=Trichosporon asahii var. asahii (strain CBS 8904) TaxID=1220162 RepID=K1VLD7_TRIAC|nr:hypothetical protein A1Q2_00699 [Trichosporon asahii var. asahii CBS 8904]